MIRIKGWACYFGNTDNNGDIVHKGAFTRDLTEFSYRPMLWSHDAKAHPIGWWELMEERDEGLWVEGVVTDEQLAVMILNRACLGLSIGYNSEKKEQLNDVCNIYTMQLLEVSITPVPMNRRCLIVESEPVEVDGDGSE